MATSPLSSSCPNSGKGTPYSYIFLIGKIIGKIEIPNVVSEVVSGYFSSLFSPFYCEENKNSSFISLDKNNIGIIDQLSIFGKTLEWYHPGNAKQLLAKFKEHYEKNKENLISVEEHANALEKFETMHKNALKTDFPDQRREEINNSFEKFSNAFKALIDDCDFEKLEIASSLLDEFNETLMQSHQLYIGLDKVISYIESQNLLFLQTFEKQFNPAILQTLKSQFDSTNPAGQGFNQIMNQNAQRSGLLDLIAEASVILQALLPETKPNNIFLLKNDLMKNDLLKIILEKGQEIASFIKADKNPDRETIRLYLTDTKACDSCKTLKKGLETLLKEQSYLFTKREKTALTDLQKDLSVISYGKVFEKKNLQEQWNQCQDIIKELLPKKTSSSQMTRALTKLDFSVIKKKKIAVEEHQNILHLLDVFMNDSKTPFQSTEKEDFINLRNTLTSINPDQNISEDKADNLRKKFRICRDAIKEIEKRFPSKEGNKLAIGQEIQKLAKHATTLSFLMLIDKTLFHSNRDFLFYRNILQKSEETSSCPKKLMLVELKAQGVSTWKILLAKVYFFVTKHLRIESYVHTLIFRVMTNYSKTLYQKLDQEYDQNQFRVLGQKILENVTIYFQLLGSATSKAKENAQRFPNELTQLIVEQLLLLKPEENEVALKELNLNDLYSKLIDDLIDKSESRLLKWVAPCLDKHKLISSIVEIGTESFINSFPNGHASPLNLFIRDGLKILYKKLQQLKEESAPEEALPPNPTVKTFVENLAYALNEYRSIQQVAAYQKIIFANNQHIANLKTQTRQLEGVIDQQIKDLENTNHITRLKLDFLKKQALGEEKRQSLSIYFIIQPLITTPLKILENLLPYPETPPYLETPEETIPNLSSNEVLRDKLKTNIRTLSDDAIKKIPTEVFTKLLRTPPSEEFLYDLIYQSLVVTNQAMECPKENKETQEAVEEEIIELLNDISLSLASRIPSTLAKNLTDSDFLSKLAEKAPWDIRGLIAPIIQERLQDIVDFVRQKALYKPELIAQLVRRLLLPVNAA